MFFFGCSDLGFTSGSGKTCFVMQKHRGAIHVNDVKEYVPVSSLEGSGKLETNLKLNLREKSLNLGLSCQFIKIYNVSITQEG